MGATAGDALSVDLLDHDLFADHEPWEVFDQLQREAPVYFHHEPDGGRGFWVLTRYDDVLRVVRDAKTFSSEVGGSARIEDLPDDVLDEAVTSNGCGTSSAICWTASPAAMRSISSTSSRPRFPSGSSPT